MHTELPTLNGGSAVILIVYRLHHFNFPGSLKSLKVRTEERARNTADDTCYQKNASDCSTCVGLGECVWCDAVPACMRGDLSSPSDVSTCGVGDWYYKQCSVSGFLLHSNVSYIILIVAIAVVVIVILVIIVCCCVHCCKKSSDKTPKKKPTKKNEGSDRKVMAVNREEPELTDDEKKQQMLNTIVATKNVDSESLKNQTKDKIGKEGEKTKSLQIVTVDDNDTSKDEEKISKNDDRDESSKGNDVSMELDDMLVSPSSNEKFDSKEHKIVFAAMNYFSEEYMLKHLGKILSANAIQDIIVARVKYGGVFWNAKQLNAALISSAAKNPNIWTSLYNGVKSCGIDERVLLLLTPQIVHFCDVKAVVDGSDSKQAILDLINSAQKYINMSVMLYFNDSDAQAITDALIAKAQEGVKIRIMVDSLVTKFANAFIQDPSRAFFEKQESQMKIFGIEIINSTEESYFDGYWSALKRKELAQKGVPEEFLQIQDYIQKFTLINLNVVYHRKFMVVDDERCWLGSLNIGKDYLYDEPLSPYPGSPTGIPSEIHQWHDGLFVISSDEFARKLNRMFALQWQCLGGDVFPTAPAEELGVQGDSTESCALFMCFPGNPVNPIAQYANNLVTHATGNITLSNPYIIDKHFYKALDEVDDDFKYKKISIVTCVDVNDHKFVPAAIRSGMSGKLKRGLNLYDYSDCGRFSHWKIMYDANSDCVMHGSFNLNTRSVVHDFEANVLVKSKKFAKQVFTLINNDILVAKKLSEEDLGKKSSQAIDNAVTEITSYFT